MTADNNQIEELKFNEITTNNGLFCQFDEKNGILLLDIKNSLNSEDFVEIQKIIDPFYESRGELKGIIVNAKKFPYWKGHQNRLEYLNFAKNNHYKFKKAALAMGGFFIKVIIGLAKGRVHPEVMKFKYNQIHQAQHWILFK